MNINEYCSKFFKYCDLINCGETFYNNKSIDNLPKFQETFDVISKLCKFILDPIYEKYGSIILTYGFASENLTKLIKKNIYPKLDQHSGYEKNQKGEYICKRLGLACDFYIQKTKMDEVTRYIINNLPFDRLYYYGDDRPIHVSYGPDHKRQLIRMMPYKDRKIPKIISKEKF